MESVGEQPTPSTSSSAPNSRLAALLRQARKPPGRHTSEDENKGASFASPQNEILDARDPQWNSRRDLGQPWGGRVIASDDHSASTGRTGSATGFLTSASGRKASSPLPYPESFSPLFSEHDWVIRSTAQSPVLADDIKGKGRAFPPAAGRGLGLHYPGEHRQVAPAAQNDENPLEHHRPAAVELNRTDSGHKYLAGPLSSSQAPSSRMSSRKSPPIGFGLPSAYTHGGNVPQEDSPSTSRALGGAYIALPSFMRFDKDTGSPSKISPGAVDGHGIVPQGAPGQKVEPSYHVPPLQQTFLPSAIARMSGMASNTASASALHGTPFESNTARAGSINSTSTVSPVVPYTSLAQSRALDDRGKRPERLKPESLGSSDGHGSSLMFGLSSKQGGSASTSLTSLRGDSSTFARKCASQEQAGPSAQRSTTHLRNRSRSATVSSTAPSEGRASEKAPPFGKRKTSDSSSILSVPFIPDMASQRIDRSVGLHMDRSLGSDEIHIGKTQQPGSAYSYTLEPPGLRHGPMQLSPISASSSGATGVSRFTTPRATPHSSTHPETEIMRNYDTTGAQGDAQADVQTIQRDAAQVDSEAQHGDTHLRQQNDARRRYLLLQQLHLDETTAHDPEASGWLEPNNGCERVFMPRPSLHNSEANHADSLRNDNQPHVAAYERHRRQPSSAPIHIYDPLRAQRLLSTTAYDELYRFYEPQQDAAQQGARPFFHHRMPPPVPDESGRSRQRTEMITIPPRTSSRIRHRARRSNASTSRRANVSGGTPGLTPNVTSDEEIEDALTPDLDTVLAQGQRLDEDRERWRAEHNQQFNFLLGRGVPRRGLKEREQQHEFDYGTRLPSHGQGDKRTASVRHAKSTPDLRRKKAFQPKVADEESVHSVPRVCFPRARRDSTAEDSHGSRHAWSRSKSSDSLYSRFRTGAAAALSGASCMRASENRMPSAPDYSDTEDENYAAPGRLALKSRGPRSASQQRERSFSVAERPGPRRARQNVARNQRDVAGDEPFVITRQMHERSTSPGLTNRVRRARDPTNQEGQVQENVSTQYAAAFSSPMPSLTSGTGQEQMRSQGRHATSRFYHRPSNSDDLRSMLQNSEANRALRQNAAEQRSRDDTARPGYSGQSVLQEQQIGERGMSSQSDRRSGDQHFSAGRTGAAVAHQCQRQRADDDPSGSYDHDTVVESSEGHTKGGPVSLPVPPRRRQGSGQVVRQSRLSTDMHTPQDQQRSATEEAQSQTAGSRLHFATPFVQAEGSTFSTPFQTPPLHQAERPQDFGGDTRPNRPLMSNSTRDLAGTLAAEAGASHHLSHHNRSRVSLRGEQSTCDEDTTSLNSSHSVGLHELWDADAHDDGFTSLFFRPRGGNEQLGPTLMSSTPQATDQEYRSRIPPSTSGSTFGASGQAQHVRPLQMPSHADEFGRRDPPSAANCDEPVPSIDSVENLIGNMLDLNLSMQEQHRVNSFVSNDSNGQDNESAWHESSIGGGEHRQSPPRVGDAVFQLDVPVPGNPRFDDRSDDTVSQGSNDEPTSSAALHERMRVGRVGDFTPRIHRRDSPARQTIPRSASAEEESDADGDEGLLQRPRAESLSASILLADEHSPDAPPSSPPPLPLPSRS